MGKKTFVAPFAGTQIRIENSWLDGAWLYFDGRLLAVNNSLFAWHNSVAFSAKVYVDNKEHQIMVLFHNLMTTKFRVFVDGHEVETRLLRRNRRTVASNGQGRLSHSE